MPPLHVFDYLLLLVIVYTAVEVVLEGRKRRWYRAIIAALFCGIFCYMAVNIFKALYIWITK